MKTKLTQTATQLGFNPRYSEMSREQSELLMSVIFSSMKCDEVDIPEEEKPHPIKMIEKRIEVIKLPITLKPSAKLAILILTDGNPGKMNAALIDCLIRFENKEVSVGEICELYPMGFYSDKSALEYIDNYLKTKKTKWSEIY